MSGYPVGAEFDPRAPYNEVETNNNCAYCGEESEGYYCSRACEKADDDD